MGLLFVVGAVVQLNDPDPAVWIFMYLCTAFLSFGVAFGRAMVRPMIALASVAGVWGCWLALGVLGEQPIFEEEGREMMGLAIICGWLAISAALVRRERRLERRTDAQS